MKQLMSLVLFCKRVHIPFEVYLFSDISHNDFSTKSYNPSFSKNPKDVIVGELKLRNVLSSRMSLIDLNKAYNYLWSLTLNLSSVDIMGGTPLNGAILAAEKVINDFRAKNKLQVVNTIFLTDGDSNPINNMDTYSFHSKKVTNIIQDQKTKKQYIVASNSNPTPIILKILKDRTGCNLLGFYLFDGNFNFMINRFFRSAVGNQFDDIKAFWKKNNFVSVNSEGYDDYYVINTRSTKSAEGQALEINTGMNKSKITKEFIKFSEKKSTNRILLNKFVDKITKVA
jgi:hypothetical protein